jgi:hypothetical protein
LCGPIISIASDALAQSGQRAGTDLDPKDIAADAAHMKQAQVGTDNDNSAASWGVARRRLLLSPKPWDLFPSMIAIAVSLRIQRPHS